ncbi:hypothetical protein Tco_0978611 [Tanacetum coccineum]|uniref:Uncharacterized protein n=1 Tax=Tanacetum coccineum TaxID=301880 RepID=A0ABQ5ENQ9_9ASTR
MGMKIEYWILNAVHNLWRNVFQQGNSQRRWEKDAKGNTMFFLLSLLRWVLLLYKRKIRIKKMRKSMLSVMYPEPVEEEVKPLYSWFVKAGEMHVVPPSITGTYMPIPYNFPKLFDQ